MGPHARRKIRNNRAQTFQFASATLYFGIPESRERNHKNSDPFYAVQSPTGQKTTQRNICCTTGDTQRLPRRLLANFPNESVIVKMKQRRRSNHSRENAFHNIDADARLVITKRAIGKDQADVKTDQGAAAPEHEPHEATDRSIVLNAFPIINPDSRKVLDIVTHFEKTHAHEHAGPAV